MGGHGVRRSTRHLFKKKFGKRGMPLLKPYLKQYKRGDPVTIYVNPSIHNGMPHKFYHGRNGVVCDIFPRCLLVRVNKKVMGKIIYKYLYVKREHIRLPWKRRGRKKEKKPFNPKKGFSIKNIYDKLITVAPIPYDIIKEGIVS